MANALWWDLFAMFVSRSEKPEKRQAKISAMPSMYLIYFYRMHRAKLWRHLVEVLLAFLVNLQKRELCVR